eukprot:Sspe_Gene.37063::Locus_17892_Transcript_1_1_Confidence_1.000_Length_764::g.37063::m.37063
MRSSTILCTTPPRLRGEGGAPYILFMRDDSCAGPPLRRGDTDVVRTRGRGASSPGHRSIAPCRFGATGCQGARGGVLAARPRGADDDRRRADGDRNGDRSRNMPLLRSAFAKLSVNPTSGEGSAEALRTVALERAKGGGGGEEVVAAEV